MFNLELQWREFNVSLPSLMIWIGANITSTQCVGLSANSSLQIHMEFEPNEQEKLGLQSYWDGLTDQSQEAQDYVPSVDLEAAKQIKKASAEAKLIALGLTQDEVNAILG